MISLERRNGRPLRIGHRGAATLGPANTLASFRLALETGVDLIEFDVCPRRDGELVVAHSFARSSRRRRRSTRCCFFVDEAPEIGVHLDPQAGRS